MTFCRSLLICALLAVSGASSAATFTANSSIDAPDNNPGDGLCRSDLLPVSTCTLRAAIMEANALPGSHIINLQSGRTYTLTRTGVDNNALNGDLDITKSLIIWCLGCAERPVLDVNGVGRGIDIHAGNVTLEGFDITGANAFTAGEDRGGAVAIREGAGTVVLTQMRLYANRASFAGGLNNEGGASTISNSELFENESILSNHGSAIFNTNDLLLRRSSVFSNTSPGGVFSAVHTLPSVGLPGRLTVENSTISSNNGPGLTVFNSQLTQVLNSTIAGNLRGLLVSGTEPVVTVRNSILARNGINDCINDAAGGLLTSSNNLYSDVSGCASLSSDLQSVDPLLSPLKLRRAGSTATPLHWPRLDSQALSAGSTLPIGQPGGCLNVDQLGISRPQGYNGIVRCDIGAAEVPDDAIFFDSVETL